MSLMKVWDCLRTFKNSKQCLAGARRADRTQGGNEKHLRPDHAVYHGATLRAERGRCRAHVWILEPVS